VDVAGNAKIYKNGSLIESGTTAVPNNITRVKNYIGKSNWPDAYYAGRIDEVRIWNTARSEADIAGNKDIELTGSERAVFNI
ncbi:LamG domain-containing protein, partial [Thermodesulfobacteriota bacterium]